VKVSEPSEIRESVRRRYAEAAATFAMGDHEQARALEASSCAGPATVGTTDQQGGVIFGAELYVDESTEDAPAEVVATC